MWWYGQLYMVKENHVPKHFDNYCEPCVSHPHPLPCRCHNIYTEAHSFIFFIFSLIHQINLSHVLLPFTAVQTAIASPVTHNNTKVWDRKSWLNSRFCISHLSIYFDFFMLFSNFLERYSCAERTLWCEWWNSSTGMNTHMCIYIHMYTHIQCLNDDSRQIDLTMANARATFNRDWIVL